MIVFGFGNFIGTTLNSIQFFDDFPSKYVPVMNIFGFIAMYIVNFFFTMRNYEHSMIVLERNVHESSCIWIAWKSCETMILYHWYKTIFYELHKTSLPGRYQKLILYSWVFNHCSKLFAQIFITVFKNCQSRIKNGSKSNEIISNYGFNLLNWKWFGGNSKIVWLDLLFVRIQQWNSSGFSSFEVGVHLYWFFCLLLLNKVGFSRFLLIMLFSCMSLCVFA